MLEQSGNSDKSGAEEKLDENIKNIAKQIIEKYKPEKIILFGSAAKGKLTPDSDLDFLVIKRDVPYYGIDRMRELSKLIERNIASDFLVCKPAEFERRLKMGDPFLKSINQEGKVLYG